MSGIIGTSHSKSKVIGRSQDTAKAWINFNGTSTVAIRDSFNVSSITDHGSGDYSVTFTNNMPNTDYAVTGSGTGDRILALKSHIGGQEATVSAFRVSLRSSTAAYEDDAYVNIVVFGD